MTGKNCMGCQAEMDADAIFCNECGLSHAAVEEIAGGHAEPIGRPVGTPYSTPITTNLPRPKSCPDCGRQIESSARYCSGCAFDFSFSNSNTHRAIRAHTSRDGTVLSDRLVNAVKKRYRDGYRVARIINGYGALIKAIGFTIGGIISLAGFVVGGMIADQASRGPFGGPGSGAGIAVGFVIVMIGVIVGAIFWIIGVIYMAQGQQLKAGFDGAVNNSPFLTDLERAEMMSLPLGGSEKKTLSHSIHTSDYTVNDDDELEINENIRAAWAYGGGAILGLLWLVVPIFFLATVPLERKFVRFHSYQAILLIVVLFVGGLVMSLLLPMFWGLSNTMVFLPWIVSLVAVGLCAWKAYNNEMFTIPIIGELASSLSNRRDESDA